MFLRMIGKYKTNFPKFMDSCEELDKALGKNRLAYRLK